MRFEKCDDTGSHRRVSQRHSTWPLIAVFCIPLLSTPADSNPVVERVSTLLNTNNFRLARYIAESSLKSATNQPELWYLLGKTCEGQNDYLSAVRAYRAGQEHGALPRAAESLCRFFLDVGDKKLAIKEVERGISASPNDVHLRYWAGVAYDANGNTNDSIKQLSKAVELDPKMLAASETLVEIYIANSFIDKATRECSRMNVVDPENRSTQYAIGRYYLAIQDFDKSAYFLGKAVSFKEIPSDWYVFWGQALSGEQQIAQAIEAFNKAIEITPTNHKAYYQRGMLYTRTGNKAGGQRDLTITQLLQGQATSGDDIISTTDPIYPFIQNKIAETLYKNGEFEGAINHCEKALAAKPDSVTVKSTLALCYLKTGLYERAIELLSNLHPYSKADPAQLYYLGQAYAGAGMNDKARQCWEIAVELDPFLSEAAAALESAKESVGSASSSDH